MLISFAGVTVSILFLVIASTQISSNSEPHSGHHDILLQIGAKSITNLENQKSILREGDARSQSIFEINAEYEDPDITCHFCTNIVYTPGKERFAAIAFGGDSLDLNGSKRLVFFLRGAEGGEKLTFLAGGKKTDELREFSNDAAEGKFPGIKFGLSEDLTLSNRWTRFSMSIDNLDLIGINYPFGMILTSGNSSNLQSIFLKGVTIDDKISGNTL
jgi:hypothetical protein